MMSPRVTQMSPAVCVAEVQQVAQHLPLGGAEVAGDRPRILGFVDRFLDLVAKRRLGFVAEDQVTHARATSGSRRRRRCASPSGG